ncbi:MAG: FAD-dependent oxidoreductase [Gemmatimonadota bacterium]|nr:FAD-dependent oxidoreductase [Gemmatimonadota bacterium]
MSGTTLVVGAGVFGAAAALELRHRGHMVVLLDAGPVPHPLAASTDISKVLRMEYGRDEAYTALMEDAFEGWRRWAREWSAAGEENLYHETGVLMVCRASMTPGTFEYESWETLRRRGHRPERLSADTLTCRFPAWSTGRYVDGFFHRVGGYAESGKVVAWLVRRAAQDGVTVRTGRMTGLLEENGRVIGVLTAAGAVRADRVVLATGAWAGSLLGLTHEIRATGHPVLHFAPRDPDRFAPERFPVFTADVARTGLYGFPRNRDGVVKVALHDAGAAIDPDAPRLVTPAQEARIRALLDETIPTLAGAEVVYRRLCLYADTQDEDFWIARDPSREGLTVASGGSGHGFKFAPVLGRLIADTVEGREHPLAHKFRWRPEVRLSRGTEAARFHGEG